jgi:RNA polymerase sigma-70 factor (ECF subfamily)
MFRSSSTTERDLALLGRISGGDRTAFEELYRHYHPRLFGYLLKLTRRPELVEEVLNDVMFTVWTDAGRFAGRSRPSTWVFGIAHHKALRALRPHGVEADSDLEGRIAIGSEPPEDRALHRELADELGRALSELSAEQRAVVELTYYEEFSYPEIAEILGCPVNTVKTRMYYARRRLREILESGGRRSGRVS